MHWLRPIGTLEYKTRKTFGIFRVKCMCGFAFFRAEVANRFLGRGLARQLRAKQANVWREMTLLGCSEMKSDAMKCF